VSHSTYPIRNFYWSYIMKTPQLAAALLAAVTVIAATPAFASGYGPAPFYRSSVGARTALTHNRRNRHTVA
jgi:hypothetical protein